MTSRGLVFPQKSARMLIGLQRQPAACFGVEEHVHAVRQEAVVAASVR